VEEWQKTAIGQRRLKQCTVMTVKALSRSFEVSRSFKQQFAQHTRPQLKHEGTRKWMNYQKQEIAFLWIFLML
jgi:hypothetical protein